MFRIIARISFIISALSIFIPASLSAQAATPGESSESAGRKVVVAIGSDMVPFYFIDGYGQPAGIVIDLWKIYNLAGIDTIDDLQPYRIGCIKGSHEAALLRSKLPQGALIELSDRKALYDAVLKGRIKVFADIEAAEKGLIKSFFWPAAMLKRNPPKAEYHSLNRKDES